MLTSWHIDKLTRRQADMLSCWHADMLTSWHVYKLTCWQANKNSRCYDDKNSGCYDDKNSGWHDFGLLSLKLRLTTHSLTRVKSRDASASKNLQAYDIRQAGSGAPTQCSTQKSFRACKENLIKQVVSIENDNNNKENKEKENNRKSNINNCTFCF